LVLKKENDIMKTKLQKLIGTAVLGLALDLQSLSAWAGSVALSEVEVESNYARGSMAGARYSSDGRQYIGCSISNGNGPIVICSAMDAGGNAFSCASTDSRWLVAAKAITDSSYIFFGSVSGIPACDYLRVGNSSFLLK
jgi:hypothetical protein